MTYLETIRISLYIVFNVVIAVVCVLVFVYAVYRLLPRRIRCKITRWWKNWK